MIIRVIAFSQLLGGIIGAVFSVTRFDGISFGWIVGFSCFLSSIVVGLAFIIKESRYLLVALRVILILQIANFKIGMFEYGFYQLLKLGLYYSAPVSVGLDLSWWSSFFIGLQGSGGLEIQINMVALALFLMCEKHRCPAVR
jgi:hypothetical protein